MFNRSIGRLFQAGPSLVRTKKTRISLPEKIPVQLLKNVPGVGAAGEILRVRPAYMRNFLHMNNKAAYILKGQAPPLPVVEREVVQVVETQEVEVTAPTPVREVTPPTNAGAMSLDELSSLFNTMKNKRSKTNVNAEQSFATGASDVSYTLSELKELVPNPYVIKGEFPVTKEYLASVIFNLTGNQVPVSAIKLVQDKSFVSEISQAGNYKWIISSPAEKASLTVSLTVN